jgi:hypothetical protein
MPMAVACGAVALALVAGGCTNSPAVTAAGGAKIKGGTAVWALPPSSAPNYIFPFEAVPTSAPTTTSASRS